jgi:hypothetical protein
MDHRSKRAKRSHGIVRTCPQIPRALVGELVKHYLSDDVTYVRGDMRKCGLSAMPSFYSVAENNVGICRAGTYDPLEFFPASSIDLVRLFMCLPHKVVMGGLLTVSDISDIGFVVRVSHDGGVVFSPEGSVSRDSVNKIVSCAFVKTFFLLVGKYVVSVEHNSRAGCSVLTCSIPGPGTEAGSKRWVESVMAEFSPLFLRSCVKNRVRSISVDYCNEPVEIVVRTGSVNTVKVYMRVGDDADVVSEIDALFKTTRKAASNLSRKHRVTLVTDRQASDSDLPREEDSGGASSTDNESDDEDGVCGTRPVPSITERIKSVTDPSEYY